MKKPQSPDQRIFATFLDSNYLPKLVVTYQSLVEHNPTAVLYAYCFDQETFSILSELQLPKLVPVNYPDFEHPELLAQLPGKTRYYEYYWSYKPHIVLETMRKTKAKIVTYIDCDFMFFQSLEPVFAEMGSADVLIQPNNFSYEESAQLPLVGYYCSCFEAFRNNRNGKKVLTWWHNACRDWCFSRFEGDKFADQKYLDKWRSMFSAINEISNVGANVAPWNVQKYQIHQKDGVVMANLSPVIYYHYHSFKMNIVDYSYMITGDRNNSYVIDDNAVRYLYRPYIKALTAAIKLLKTVPLFSQLVHNNPNSDVKLLVQDDGTVHFSYRKVLGNNDV